MVLFWKYPHGKSAMEKSKCIGILQIIISIIKSQNELKYDIIIMKK